MNNLALHTPSRTERRTPAAGHWHARLELQFQQSRNASRLRRCRHQGPLYVQKPFYPEGPELAHVYLLHPPGGLVSGDRLNVEVGIGEGAGALLTTPGAGRVYRARDDGAPQQQQVTLRIAEGASLEWLPLESILFPGANARLTTQVELSGNSRFIGWDITAFGLPACNTGFDRGELQQRLQINRGGEPLLIEALHLNDASRALFASQAGLQSYANAGLFIAGPFSDNLDDDLLVACRSAFGANRGDFRGGISQVGEFLVARMLGQGAEQLRLHFCKLWALLRPPLLGRPCCPPRIWNT